MWHNAIAKASDASVRNHKNNIVEIGYKDISILRKNTILHKFPEKVYHWHKQGINLPKNAVHLAYNSTFDVQAYSIGNKIFGFQFHPESCGSPEGRLILKEFLALNQQKSTNSFWPRHINNLTVIEINYLR